MIERISYIKKIQNGFANNPIVILTGARQVGKTTLMEMFVKDKTKVWLDGQNIQTAELFVQFSIIERYLNININSELNGLLVIDEFQYINKISTMLKLLVDKYKNLKILCSGSSSLNIIQNVKESLAGRVRVISVYPLNFLEYVNFQNTELLQKYEITKVNDNIDVLFPQIKPIFYEYLTYGGLPKVAKTHDIREKIELLNDIYQTYLSKDIKQFIINKDFVAFNKLLKILSSQIGNMLNINEIANTINLPYSKCEEYISILEQMFIIKLLSPFSSNRRKEISKMKKIYFCDTGLRNIVYNSFNDINIRVDKGQIFENYVYLQLLINHKPKNIYYYRTKDNTEIDFIIKTYKGNIIPVEAKFKSFNKTQKIRAITEFAKKYNTDINYIVNNNLHELNNNQQYIQAYHIHHIV
ncbi:MAG: ATP-binding protein [Bacteroidales bacterium]|jgi:predicted AAA+ superfamily ATPase|nr:ATP-binding protein [Bacteroidales bacterium]MDY0141241.1 ATP-binding protein [Bacteroidales bacterium]